MSGGLNRDSFQQLLQERDEPDWCRRLRQQAFDAFEQLPMPPRSHEEWRRTDIRLFSFDRFRPAALAAAAADQAEPPLDSVTLRLFDRTGVEGHRSVVDGREVSRSVAEQLQRRGVIFCSMDEAVREHSELVGRYLSRAVDPTYDKFAAAHAAFWAGGTFLYVPRNVVIEAPLHVVSALTVPAAAETGHVLVVLDEGAEATLFIELLSPPTLETGVHLGATELFVGRGARLKLVTVQDLSLNVWNFAHQRAICHADAQLDWSIGVLGSKLSKVNQEVELRERGAEADVHGVMFARQRQHLSYHTRQWHRAGATRSDLLFRGALTDRARIVWRGMIRVEPGALRTNAYQRNDNLVLSDHARADSIPGLEIEADDVRCTHGATAGHVDPEQVFYMQSRGVERDEAVHMIVEGFFTEVIQRIAIPSVRAALRAAVAEKLGFPLAAPEEALELASL